MAALLSGLCPGGGGAYRTGREATSRKEDGESRESGESAAQGWLEEKLREGPARAAGGIGCLGSWVRHTVCLRPVWRLLKDSLPLTGPGSPQRVFCRGAWSPPSPSSSRGHPRAQSFLSAPSGAGPGASGEGRGLAGTSLSAQVNEPWTSRRELCRCHGDHVVGRQVGVFLVSRPFL